jgi:hypothetical protein
MSEYTKALAASMQATQRALTEALAKNLFNSRRDKQHNNEIHGVEHGLCKQTQTVQERVSAGEG